MSSTGGAGPPIRTDMSNQLITLFGLLIAMFVLFDPDLRRQLGEVVGYAFTPLIGFDGEVPIVTLVLAGMAMTIFSVMLRHLFIDWVDQARNARISSAFSKELRQARQSNNTYKLKKLTEMQPQIMAQSMKSSQTQFRMMPITMLVIVPIFAWLSNFVYFHLGSTTFSVPWEFNAEMTNTNVLPNWILLYSLSTLPISQVLQRVLKHLTFSKRLRELEEKEASSGEGVSKEA